MPSTYLEKLVATASLRESTLKAAIKALELPNTCPKLSILTD
jgi:hypothetical protein